MGKRFTIALNTRNSCESANLCKHVILIWESIGFGYLHANAVKNKRCMQMSKMR